MELRLDNESVEIHKRPAVVIFTPWDADDDRMFRSNQFRVARGRIPFAHDERGVAFAVEESAKRRHGILICAVPVLSEIVRLEKSFEPLNQLVLHKRARFYDRGRSSG